MSPVVLTTEQLTELIEAHQAELFRYLKYLGASHTTAEDLLQEIFIRAYKAKSQPDLEVTPVRLSWLRRIAHNLYIDHCRRNNRSPISFDSEMADQAESFWQNEFIEHDQGFGCLAALEQCLGELPERQRAMVQSFYAARNSRDQLAEDFGISSDGVKMALRRTRRALASCIQQRLVEV